jgi:hypothetical protein
MARREPSAFGAWFIGAKSLDLASLKKAGAFFRHPARKLWVSGHGG